MILQIIDLVWIALLIAALITYRFMIARRIRKVMYKFPRPELYSLKVTKLPKKMTAKEFSTRFINKDNVIQTALVKDCAEIYRCSEKTFKLDKEIKQLQINLMEGPHVAKVSRVNRQK